MPDCACGHDYFRHQDGALAPECLDCECRRFTPPSKENQP